MPEQRQEFIQISPMPFEQPHSLAWLSLLLLLLGTTTAGCKAQKPDAKPAEIVLKASEKASHKQLLQTKKILDLRLKKEGFTGATVKLKGQHLRVSLPAKTAKQWDAQKHAHLLSQGVLSLAPLKESSPTLDKCLKKTAKLEGFSMVREDWRGPDQSAHHSFALHHAQRAQLEKFLDKEGRPTLGEIWVVQSHAQGGFAAYLLDRLEELKLHQLQKVALSKGGRSYDLQLLPGDGEKLHGLTSRNLGKRLFMRMDQKVLASPVIMAAIRGSAVRVSMLSGGTPHPLLRLLGIGALPLPLKIDKDVH